MVESTVLTLTDSIMKDDDDKGKEQSKGLTENHGTETVKDKKHDCNIEEDEAEKQEDRSSTPRPSKFQRRRSESGEEITRSDAMRNNLGELREPGSVYWYADHDDAREPQSNIRPVTPPSRLRDPREVQGSKDPEKVVES